MKLARKAIITIMTMLALLAGASAAAATTASAATTGPRLSAPVSRGTTGAPTRRCTPATPKVTTSLPRREILTWKCPKYNKGDYFVWELFVVLGHPPGS